jgi:hypothetical protein
LNYKCHRLKHPFAKISFILLFGLIIIGCNTTKKVPNGRQLLTNNTISVDNEKVKTEEIVNQLYQKQNSSILGYKHANLYNLAKEKADSIYKAKYLNNPAKYYRKAKCFQKNKSKD